MRRQPTFGRRSSLRSPTDFRTHRHHGYLQHLTYELRWIVNNGIPVSSRCTYSNQGHDEMSITSQAISCADLPIRGRIRRAGARLRLLVICGRPESKRRRSGHATALMMRGGLAPRQIAAVTTYLEDNIGCSIQTADLAQLIGLSPTHFCRAFRQSVGISPHAYLMRRRVARAQRLMLSTCASLAQIAADCGLTDQAHFTRLFRRFVGESPGAWRRTRAPAPPQ